MATAGTGSPLSLAYSRESVDSRLEQTGPAASGASSATGARELGPSADVATPLRRSTIVPISRVTGRTLSQPLYAVVEEIDEGVVATIYDLDLFEFGSDEHEALEALREAVTELFDVLLRDGENLGPELEDQRRFIASLIAKA